jgi:hypothetical protein
MRPLKHRLFGAVVFLIPLFLLLTLKALADEETADINECVGCHTNLKKLMDLSWVVKKIKPKEEFSKEISGEG